MRPPSFRLATHLIRVTPVDDSTPDEDHGMQPSYESDAALAARRAYLGIVEQMGQSEDDDGIVYSSDAFTLTVFCLPDPTILSQAKAEWAKRPANFPNPAYGSSGVVAVPDGWVPEKVALVIADANALDYGCWTTKADART